ncbi:MAG: cupin domain-containing protein [Psychrosphaera sp.]|nr:cupin domain-containing protein [Psychrosphaera sp.]
MKPFIFVAITLLLSSFWVTVQAQNDVKIEVLAKTSKSWNGQLLPHYPSSQPEITMLKVTIPAGTRLPKHMHLAINAAVLLKGKLTVVSEDGKKLYLKAGDPIVELVNTWHYGLNEDVEPAELIVFYAGTANVPITIKKSSSK